MNRLDKFAKDNFNGDLKAAWSYLLYEAPKEERDEITKYVSMEQLNIGMTAIRRTEPETRNEIDELASSKFDGDLKKTWDYIFSSCSSEEIDRYVSMADAHQAAMAFMMLNEEIKKLPRKERRAAERLKQTMEALQMSREELGNMQKNPYKAPLLKSILKVVLGIALILGLTAFEAYMGMDEEAFTAGMSTLGIVNSLFAFDLAAKLRDYFRFRSVKKALEKTEGYSVI